MLMSPEQGCDICSINKKYSPALWVIRNLELEYDVFICDECTEVTIVTHQEVLFPLGW